MDAKFTLVHDLAQAVANDPQLAQRMSANPAETLTQLSAPPPPLQSDKLIYRSVVWALGLAVLITLIGAIVLTAMKVQEVPQVLTAIGSAAVGALAGLLAPSPATPR